MRDVAWRAGFTMAALAVLVLLGPSASCGLGNRLVERAWGQTPRAQIARYLDAIAEGDRHAALAHWSPAGSPNTALKARRESVTDELLAYGPRLEHRVLDIEWWRTCCEPGVIDDPHEAGGAHVRVAISGENRAETIYVFDILVPGGYWGGAMGNPVRHWAIVDLYPQGAAPLAWPWVTAE